jgi:two-component system response regulator TctD
MSAPPTELEPRPTATVGRINLPKKAPTVHLLLVEDESALAESLSGVLTARGHRVDWASDGLMALNLMAQHPYDLAVLDLGLPKLDGMQVLKKLRESNLDLPVLILSARDQVQDKVAAIHAGADDYLSKPFDTDELEARLFGLMRRRNGVSSARLEWAGVSYDAGQRSFACAEQPLQLSPREHATLLALVEAQGSPLARQALFDRVFVDDTDIAADAMDVVLYRLRKRLGELGVAIRNVRGIGFYLDRDRP